MIKKIYKKNVPQLLNDSTFWDSKFLSITKHRLYAHYLNPNLEKDDIVLLFAYDNQKLVGYMGVFIDVITINNQSQKIGWLSTWWVDPKTKGKGIGRAILQTMYESLEGKIGISQFTNSAKRVYEKSGYFNTLQFSKGYKFVFRSNSQIVLPLINSKFKKIIKTLSVIDYLIDIPISVKNKVCNYSVIKKLKQVNLEYINNIDDELYNFIKSNSKNHISQKSKEFFEWLKANHWVQESPLVDLTPQKKYEFSVGAKRFNIYLIKILKKEKLIAFVVIQLRDHLLKVLFIYYTDNSKDIANVILAHVFKLKCKELICYDEVINSVIKKSYYYIYRRTKNKESIISKAFGVFQYDKYTLNFGDGDCCFA